MIEHRTLVVTAVLAILVLDGCTQHYRWIAPHPDFTSAQMAIDNEQCQRADSDPKAYASCMERKGYRQAPEENIRNEGGMLFHWVDLNDDDASAYNDLSACSANAPSETTARIASVENCMTQRGYHLWTGREADDFSRAEGETRVAYADCMANVDRELPLSQIRPNDFICRRELHAACMAEKGYYGSSAAN